ncbi:MAG TPA: hypothetical protein VIC59_01705 [Gemmatimonadota bacterium]
MRRACPRGRRFRPPGQRWLPLGVMAVITACGGGAPRLRVEAGAAGAPVFMLSAASKRSAPFPLATLQVHSCRSLVAARPTSWIPPREQAAWYVDWWPRGSDHPAPAVERVVYGEIPRGMTEDRPAAPLDAEGCYVVQAVSATGAGGSQGVRAGFRIADGAVLPLAPAEIDSLVRGPRTGG